MGGRGWQRLLGARGSARVLWAAWVISGCSNSPPSGGGGGAEGGGAAGNGGGAAGADAAAVDAPVDATSEPCSNDGSPYALRVFDLLGCDGRGPGSDACYARVWWNPSRCCASSLCD